MGFGNVVDKLSNQHSLSDTGTAKQTNLSTTSIWGQQIDDLSTKIDGLETASTLIPVSNSSGVVLWSTNEGGSAWMGATCLVLIGPRSSTGSPVMQSWTSLQINIPMTLMILPRHSGPTGTWMGAPVSRTFCPRTRPNFKNATKSKTEKIKWMDG